MSKLMKGTLVLTVAAIISKFIGSFFRIPLQNIAGDDVFGIFSLVYPIYMVILTISVAGIPLALSVVIAQAKEQGNDADISSYIYSAKRIAIFFGLFSFVLVVSLSEPLANLIGGGELQFALIVVTATVLVAPYMAVHRGLFQGFGTMTPTAFSQVIEQLVRVATLLVLAYVLTKQGVATELTSGFILSSSILGVLAALFYLKGQLKKQDIALPAVELSREESKAVTSKLLKLAIPLSVGSLAIVLLAVIDSLVIPFTLQQSGGTFSYQEFGVFSRGVTLMQIVTVFATTIVLPLVPQLSKVDPEERQPLIQKALKYNYLLVLGPTSIALVLTSQLNIALFTSNEGTFWIQIHLVTALAASVSAVLIGILQGMQKGIEAAKLVLLVCGIKLLTTTYFVWQFGFIGAAVSTLLVYIVLTALLVWKVKTTVEVPLFPKYLVIYVLASLASIVVLVGVLQGTGWMVTDTLTRMTAWLSLTVCGFIGMVVYASLVWKWR